MNVSSTLLGVCEELAGEMLLSGGCEAQPGLGTEGFSLHARGNRVSWSKRCTGLRLRTLRLPNRRVGGGQLKEDMCEVREAQVKPWIIPAEW